MTRPVVAVVVGATGAQVDGLVEAVRNDPQQPLGIRLIARTPGSPAMADPGLRGFETVVADPNDRASLVAALRGAQALFLPAAVPTRGDPDDVVRRAENLVHAARVTALEHVVWSTFEDPGPAGVGPGSPSTVVRPAVDLGLLLAEDGVPTTTLRTALCWEQLLGIGVCATAAQDAPLRLELPLGTASLAGIAARDIGGCAYGVLRRGRALTGVDLGIAGEHLTGQQLAGELGRHLGREVRYVPTAPGRSTETIGQPDDPGAPPLLELVRYAAGSADAHRALRSTTTSRRLHPQLLDFRGWLEREGYGGHGYGGRGDVG